MKRSIRKVGVVLGVVMTLISVSVSAKTNVTISPYRSTPYSVVTLVNPTKAPVKLMIMNKNNGSVLFTKKMESLDLSYKLFDFSKLENGEYNIVLLDGDEKIILPFNIVNGSIYTEKEKSAATAQTFVGIKDGRLIVSIMSEEKVDNGFMSIVDSFGRTVYEKNLNYEINYSGKYNIASLPKGDYTVNILSGSNTFSYNITK